MSSRDRALNYAVRVKGQQEAVAAFRTVGQAATASISAIAAARQAAGVHDEAVARATATAAAFGAAQAQAGQQIKDAKAAFAAGTMGAEQYQRTLTEARNGLSVFKAENTAAAREVDSTARAMVAAQQAAANYGRQLQTARGSASSAGSAPDQRTGVQRLIVGDASVDRAALSATTLEQVLGRVAMRGPAVTAAMETVARAERDAASSADAQSQSVDRLRARYNPLYATIRSYLAEVRQIRQAEADGVLSADERVAALSRERQATLAAIVAIKQQGKDTIDAHTRMGASGMIFQHVVRSTTDSFVAGLPPAMIFGEQIGRLSEAAALSGGAFGKFGAVMAGPWGIAVSAGVAIASVLLPKLLANNDAISAGVDKLNEDAEAQKKADAAHVAFSRTLEGQIALQQKLNEEMERGLQSQRETNQQNLLGAQQKIDDAQRTLSTLSRDLVTAQAALKDVYNTAPDTMNSSASTAYSQRLSDAKAKVADIERRIKAAYKDIDTAQQGVRDAKAVIAVDDAQAVVDPLKAIANKYQDLRDAAIEAAKGNDELTKSLKQTLTAINLKEKAEREAAEQNKKTQTETTAFAMPVNGRISGQFGEQRPGHLHAGLDIAVPVGTPVKADAGGTIIEAGTLPGYGNVVFIDHGSGTISRLAHLSAINVKKGDVVGAGDVIGLSGGAKGAPGSGDSTGPHVHYEVRVRGRSVDPRKGPFPTDNLGSADKAASEQQRLREEAVRHQKAFDDQSAQLDGAILSAKRANINDADKVADFEKQQIAVEQAKTEADINAKVALREYSVLQGKVLVEKSKQLAGEKTLSVETQQLVEHLHDAVDAELAASSNRMDMLGLEQGLAKTIADRRDLSLAILAEEEKQARIKAQTTIDEFRLGKATKEQADEAQAALANLDKLHPLKVENIKRQNTGALGKYLQDTDPATVNDRVETLVTNELTSVRDGIDEALTNALGVKDPMLKGLLEIFLDEVLFRPIAEALQKSRGGGGGGFGSILGAIGSLFGGSVGGGGGALAGNLGADWGDVGGSIFSPSSASSLLSSLPGFASGTDDLPRGLSWVGENGRELLFNGGGGRISVLNNQQSRHAAPMSGGHHSNTTIVNINSPQPSNPRRIGAVVGRSNQLAAGRAVRKGLAAPRYQR